MELCSFSGYKIYPGHGRRYARTDGKVSAAPGTDLKITLKITLKIKCS